MRRASWAASFLLLLAGAASLGRLFLLPPPVRDDGSPLPPRPPTAAELAARARLSIDEEVLDLEPIPAGRVYRSEHPQAQDLNVDALLHDGRRVHVASSAASSVTTPACLLWWITPDFELSNEALALLAKDLWKTRAPGLSLRRWEMHGCILHERRGNITGEVLAVLGNVDTLRWLDLASTRIDDLSLRHLTRLKGLRHLDLGGCTITSDGLAYVAFSAGELAFLRELRSLRELTLSGRTDEETLALLPKLPLERLTIYIDGKLKVSDVVARLKETMPACEVDVRRRFP